MVFVRKQQNTTKSSCSYFEEFFDCLQPKTNCFLSDFMEGHS